MGEPDLRAAAELAAAAFAGGQAPEAARPLGEGLIHRTYAVRCGDRDLVVQRLNTAIFRDPDALTENLLRVTEHLASRETRSQPERRSLQPLRTSAGVGTHRESNGAVWRAFLHIRDAEPARADADLSTLADAAAAFGDYARNVSEIPGPPLHTILPGFHDFARRRADFEERVARDAHGRAQHASPAIAAARSACEDLERLLPEASVARLPVRVAHHDCKLGNLLVDAASGEPLCVIDLDTTMAGTWVSDFGELVRSSAASAPEDAAVDEPIEVDLAAFAALTAGWLQATGTHMVEAERRALPLAGARLALMNGLRFLTDYLDGDVYFRQSRPHQNLDRGIAQTRLARAHLARSAELRDCVERSSS